MYQINYIEKIVLAAIMKGHVSFEELQMVTSLSLDKLRIITKKLVDLDYIHQKSHLFLPRVSANHSSIWTHYKEEIFELIDISYQRQKNFNFKLAKFNACELKEYTRLSKRLEVFIKSCNQKKSQVTDDLRYIFWGELPQNEALAHHLRQ